WIEQQPIGQPLEPVQALHELAFVIGSEESRLEAEFMRKRLDSQLQLIQGDRAIVRRVAAAQLVQVDAVHDLDPIAHRRHAVNSRTAAINNRGSTSHPGFGSPGASSRTNGTGREPSRFLSRAVAIT